MPLIPSPMRAFKRQTPRAANGKMAYAPVGACASRARSCDTAVRVELAAADVCEHADDDACRIAGRDLLSDRHRSPGVARQMVVAREPNRWRCFFGVGRMRLRRNGFC